MRWQDWVWFHTRPPLDRVRDEDGVCDVCGRTARFLYNRWSIVPHHATDFRDPGVLAAYRRRESMWCSECGASTRERGLWRVLIGHYGGGATSGPQLVEAPAFSLLRIAEINRLNAGHDLLARVNGVTYSEYPDEDIQSLSYPDATFDLVITSDTLEHVPDHVLALKETRRILRPGGRHVFTVPLRPDLPASQDRAGLPPIYHGVAPGPLALLRGPSEDMLALHDFAMDFFDAVRAVGFDVELHGDGVETVICATAT